MTLRKSIQTLCTPKKEIEKRNREWRKSRVRALERAVERTKEELSGYQEELLILRYEMSN